VDHWASACDSCYYYYYYYYYYHLYECFIPRPVVILVHYLYIHLTTVVAVVVVEVVVVVVVSGSILEQRVLLNGPIYSPVVGTNGWMDGTLIERSI